MERLTTPNNVEHGLVLTLANAVQDHGYKNLPDAKRTKMLAKKKHDLELVRVRYHNLKNQENGRYEGWYIGHPGEPMRKFVLLHEHSYVIPRGCAEEINALGQPVRSGLVGTNGIPLEVDGKKDRTHLVSIEGTA